VSAPEGDPPPVGTDPPAGSVHTVTRDTPPFVAVIMAGGQGQRFWPLSTPERPKQFLDLSRSGRTLIQATFDRVVALTGAPERVLVATAERYLGLVAEQLPEVPAENVLVEPTQRDSAPAIALACLTIERRFGDVVAGFFSSDHQIAGDGFGAALQNAIALADAERGLVTIGITPTRPSTGYGYIEMGEGVAVSSSRAPAASHGLSGYRVARFVEKPNVRTAEAYLEAGGYLWNAGIFVWRVGAALNELDLHAPQLMSPLRVAFAQGEVAATFPALPRISIDYALMERTERALVVPGSFAWDDIGDWVALERLMAKDENPGGPADTNTVVGRHVGLDASGNIVYTEDPEDVVVTLGVHDLVIVKRGNALLLVHKERVQEIKALLADERMVEFLAESAVDEDA
jgi:mannose-1-phosphate guanylyltransferase